MLLANFVWLFSLVLIYVVLKWFYETAKRKKQFESIPGPPVHPIFENAKEIFHTRENLFVNIRKMAQDYFPIYKLWILNKPSVNMMAPEDAELVLSSTKHSEKSDIYNLIHPWLGAGLLTSSGAKWQSRRKILTPAFHFNILQQFVGVFTEQTNVLVEQLGKECGQLYTNIVPYITQTTLHSICETAMGTSLDGTNEIQKQYRSAVHRMGEIILYRICRPWLFVNAIYNLTSAAREESRLLKILHKFTRSVIQDRKSKYKDLYKQNELQNENYSTKKRLAMLDLLISAGALIDDEGIREEVDTFMFEGHDTTSASLCFTLMLLANHPDIQMKVFQELEEIFGDSNRYPTYQDLQEMRYMERVVKESLRMYPSVPFIGRIASEDILTYTGYKIPAGTFIHIHIYDMHHNPEIFPDPKRFDPDRFLPENTQNRHPFAYIPFSAGPRNCIGQKFAILELKAVISGILRKFVLKPVTTPDDIVLIPDLVLRANSEIRVKFCERTK